MSVGLLLRLVIFPRPPLLTNELLQSLRISQSIRTQRAVPANLAGDIVHGFTMPSNPDHPGCQIEVHQIRHSLDGQKSLDLITDHLPANVDH